MSPPRRGPPSISITTATTSPPSVRRSPRPERCLDTSRPEPPLTALYQELILDHYRRPRNKGVLEHPTHSVALNNPLCGDEIDLQLQVEGGVITDLRFLAGVSKFPVRVKCALLPWNALKDAVKS